MKKIFTLLFSSLLVLALQAQPVIIEDFNYTAGQPLTSNGWTQIGTTSTNPISVTATGLTYTGYAGSGIGNAAALTTTGQDIYTDGTTSISSGAVYVSFMLNVSAAQAAGDYFFALLPTTSTTNYTARTFIKSSGTGYVMGVSKSSETPVYGTTELAFNTTYLVVVKYEFLNVSGTDDAITLYVSASGVPATEPATPYAGPAVGTVSDAASLGRVALRQGSASNSATLTIDGIRMGDSWAEGPLPVQLVSFVAAASNRDVNLNWSTANELNLAGFEVQRSINGKDFMPLTLVQASGAASKSYSYTDEKAVPGLSYYRLKMTDKDGSFKFSAIATVKIQSIGVGVYPNPVKSFITVQHEAASAGAVISILDLTGKQTLSVNVQAGAVQTSLNAGRLAPGSYLVVFNNNGNRTTRQFVKE